MKHVKHGKKLISLLLSAAVAMSMTLSTVMTPLAASSSVSDLRQKLQDCRLSRKRSTSSSRTRRATRPTLRLSKRSLSSRRH